MYQIVKKNQFNMNISLVSFLLISIFICLTISAKTDRLSRRYGDSIQSSMPTYPLSYSVIQGVFDQDGKNIRNFFRYILHYKAYWNQIISNSNSHYFFSILCYSANERQIERTSKSYLLSDSSSKQIYNAPGWYYMKTKPFFN